MMSSCPRCGGPYRLLASDSVAAPAATPAKLPKPDACRVSELEGLLHELRSARALQLYGEAWIERINNILGDPPAGANISEAGRAGKAGYSHHAIFSHTCVCGRVCKGNGGWNSHKRACKAWQEAAQRDSGA